MFPPNQYPQTSWEARLESLILVGRAEVDNPPRNIRDLAKIVGKVRSDAGEVNGITFLDAEQLWTYAALMTHHLLWRRNIPHGYSLDYDAPTEHYPDITNLIVSFDVIGIPRNGEELLVPETKLSKSTADHFIFVRGNSFWIYSRNEVACWEKKEVAPHGKPETLCHFLSIAKIYADDVYLAMVKEAEEDEKRNPKEVALVEAVKQTAADELVAKMEPLPVQENCELIL